MNQNDANLGLLSNKSNAKYKEPKQNNDDFEFQDYREDQEYVSLDDAKVQHTEVIQPKQIEQPIAPPQNNIQNQSELQKNQNQYQAQQQNQLPAQQQIQYPQFQQPQQQQLPINQYQNQYSQYQYTPYQNQQYSQPQNQILNSVSNIFQQTATLIDRSINIKTQAYSTCIYCKTPQMIQDEKQPFMCFRCQQINKPNFGYFQCGSCKITVMYQCGLSNLIKCTKCQTMNYVQQPNLPNTLQQYQQSQQQQNLQQQQLQQQQINGASSQLFQSQNQYTNQQRLSEQSQYCQQNKEQKSIARNQIDPMYQEK